MSDATYIAKRIAELEAEVERLRQVIADEIAEYWVCACVKRDRAGNMTHFKGHCQTVTRCPKCKCERPESWLEEIQSERAKRRPTKP